MVPSQKIIIMDMNVISSNDTIILFFAFIIKGIGLTDISTNIILILFLVRDFGVPYIDI